MEKLRFLHIPKTAGASLTALLKRIYGGPACCFIFTGNFQADLRRYTEHPRKSEIRFVGGHAPFRTGIAEIDRLPAITLLRHPVERVKSYCQHVYEGKSPELSDRFPPERFCLDEFLASGEPQLDNLQVRMLTGHYVGPIDASNQAVLVRRAIEVVEGELAGFGLTEQFDQSVLLWKLTFDWPPPTFLRLNSRRGPAMRFTSEQVERIISLNRADLELYDAAAATFPERLAQHRQSLDDSLRQFRRRQRVFHACGWIYQLGKKAGRRLLRRAA